MERQNKERDNERLLLDLYQEKIRYIVDDRKVDEIWDWKSTLQKFRFRSPDKIGMPKADLKETFKEAERLLEMRAQVQVLPANNMIVIRKLGRQAVKPADMCAVKPEIEAAVEIAHILSAHPESDIFLRAESRINDLGETKTEFALGSASLSADSLASMVRGAYGRVEYEKVERERTRYPIKCYAVADQVVRSKQELERLDREQKWESWITPLLTSLACSRCFTAEFCFHPMIGVEEKNWLEKLTADLENIYKELAFYSEIGWNNGINGGGNITFKNSAWHNIADNMHFLRNAKQDGIESNENYSFSFAENSKITDQYALRLMSEIECRLIGLRHIYHSVGWAVIISVSALDEETVDAVTAIVSGTAQRANISLKWQQSPCVAMIASNHDILPLMMFPAKEFNGFEFVENENYSLVSPESQEDGLYVGNILWNKAEVSRFYLSRQVLNRHAFICGMTGAGKTNTLFQILEGIAVPFWVIEPVKGEYRSLKGHYEDTKVWTMRTSDSETDIADVLQINPFWFPQGSSLTFHIDSIKTIISSAFELSAAMPNIVEQCLYNVYLKAGWNIIANSNVYRDILPEEYLYPSFSDFTNEVADYLDKSDFGEEVLGNYKGALLSRLKSFTNGAKGVLLNTAKHPDYGLFATGRNIIELEGLADDADKCLVMGTILVQYYQYLKGHFHDQDKKKSLQHIIVIEEAHRLFKNVKPQSRGMEGPDPAGQLVESLSNIMAEIRAFGEGMLIVDQSPTKVAEDVIKNSGTKIIHRIDNEKDIKMLQSAMLMPNNTIGFSALSQGEALIRSDAMLRPCKVKVLCSEIKESYSLAESFKAGKMTDYSINDMYIANTIVQNERIYMAVQSQIQQLLRSFVWMEWSGWYDVINVFLLEIIQILKDNYVFDRAQGRLSVIIQVISAAVKKMYRPEGTKNMGLVHMFVMRFLEFYLDARKDRKVKPAAIEMLQVFFRDRLCQEVLYSKRVKLMDDDFYQQFLMALGLEKEQVRAYQLYSYLCCAVDKLKDDQSVSDGMEEITVEHFLYDNTLLGGNMYKQYYQELEDRFQVFLSNINIDLL